MGIQNRDFMDIGEKCFLIKPKLLLFLWLLSKGLYLQSQKNRNYPTKRLFFVLIGEGDL